MLHIGWQTGQMTWQTRYIDRKTRHIGRQTGHTNCQTRQIGWKTGQISWKTDQMNRQTAQTGRKTGHINCQTRQIGWKTGQMVWQMADGRWQTGQMNRQIDRMNRRRRSLICRQWFAQQKRRPVARTPWLNDCWPLTRAADFPPPPVPDVSSTSGSSGTSTSGADFRLAMIIKAGARRNDVTHDDVFLEAAQVVNLGTGRGLGEHAGRVLEARGAQEAVGFQRRLGDAQQHGRGFGGFAALLLDAFVLGLELQFVNLFAPEELRVAGFGDAHLAQHLADDDFDVLVVDGHALETINFLHFADEVFLQFLRSADLEDFVRIHRAFGELLAFLDHVALEDDDVACRSG